MVDPIQAEEAAVQNGRSEAVASLTDAMYAALLAESSWKAFLEKLRGVLPNGKAVIFFHDAARREGAYTLNAGVDRDFAADYESYYCKKNPWMSHATIRPLGRAVVSDSMLPRKDLIKTEHYNDHLKPQGLCLGIGVTLLREEDRNFMVSVVGADAEEAAAKEAAATLQALVPHLRRAFGFYRRPRPFPPVIEGWPSVGVLSITDQRKIRSANFQARQLLERGNGIWVDRSGALATSNSELGRYIRSAPSLWGSDQPRAGARGFLIQRRGRRLPLKVTVYVPSGIDESSFFRGPECVLFLEDPGSRLGDGVKNFASHYRLTPAQRQVVEGLAAGRELAEIAAHSNLSIHTVRTHLKHIFAKCGSHRQIDVVRDVHRLG